MRLIFSIIAIIFFQYLYAQKAKITYFDKFDVFTRKTENAVSYREIIKDKENKIYTINYYHYPSNKLEMTGTYSRINPFIRNGKFKVPNSSFEINGTPEDPAVAIRLYRDGKPTDTVVGHKMKTLNVKKSMEEIDLEKRSLEDLDLKPTESMASNARRGLELRRKFGRGGTAVGVARARDLANRKELSPGTVLRMYSFFSRHEVDKQGKDWNNSERPSNGKIAWLLWGGDSGYAWAKSKRNAIMNIRSQKSNDTVWQESPFSLRKNIDKQ